MKKATIFIIAFIAVITFLIFTISQYQIFDDQYGEFELIAQKDSFNSKFVILRIYKGYSYIKLADNRQIVLRELRNYNYSPYSLDNLIPSCDSVSKRKDSNMIYIYSAYTKKRYEFVLDRNIEKEQQ